ncbi:hypothetical protein B0H34DRAFT_861813 [Crassisporium funariophilum]|nr:hypothetical protein B0H34DRAFT_861813 [Crassisporium funariophilum]
MSRSRNNGYLQQLFNLQRKYTTSKVRKTQTKTLCKKIKKTAAEKAACAQQRRQSWETFTKDLQEACQVILAEAVKLHQKHGGHDIKYYTELLYQDARQKDKRQISDWNGWVQLEGKRLNEELGHGERLKAHNITVQAKTTWQKMSSNKQKAAAAGVQGLEEAHEVRKLGKRNIPLSAFHNTKKTLEHIEHQLLALHAHASTEVALIAARSNQDHYNPPHIIISSTCVSKFFDLGICQTLPDFALHFDAFCLSGVQSIAKNYIQTTLEMKKNISIMILDKLCQAAGVPVPHMCYSNFDHFIMEKYHIILEGWPLEKLCSPSDIASRNEISVLMASFDSSSTCFRKLSAAEFEKWSNDRFNTAVESTSGPTTTLQDSSLAPPSSPHAPSPLSESPVPPTLIYSGTSP